MCIQVNTKCVLTTSVQQSNRTSIQSKMYFTNISKRNLFKITNGNLLTYEETTTFLCQVEAILNSISLTLLLCKSIKFTCINSITLLDRKHSDPVPLNKMQLMSLVID